MRGKKYKGWKNRIQKKKPSIVTKKIVSLFILLTLVPLYLSAGDIKGKLYINNYYASDSGNYDHNVSTAKVKLYKTDDEASNLSFNADGRIRARISDGDVHDDIPEYDMKELWLGYRFYDRRLKAAVGRQDVEELYNTSIDGINMKYFINEGFGFGLFGGLAPDKYDNSFNTKFRSAGLYGFMNHEKYDLAVGYENLMYKGKTDREYVSVRFSSNFPDKVRLYALSSVSMNQITKDIDVENINISIAYAPSKNINLTLFHNYYRAIKYYESAKIFADNIDLSDSYYLDYNSQSRTGARVDYRVSKDLKVYASTAYEKRKIDNKDAVRYTAGFMKNELVGFDVAGRYTYSDNYTSKDNEFNIELSRDVADNVEVSVYASHEKEELDNGSYTTGMLTYGASTYWQINRNYNAFVVLERYDEDDYNNTSVYTQIGYRF